MGDHTVKVAYDKHQLSITVKAQNNGNNNNGGKCPLCK